MKDDGAHDDDNNENDEQIDEDDNGSSDIMAFDTDQDGKWDRYEKIS